MVDKEYIPQRGDVVWIDFDPQTGHEQSGRRPALIISPKVYNQKVGLALICPITSHIKGYAFEVIIESKLINGAILSDQIKSFDWKVRSAELAMHVNRETLREVMQKLLTLLTEG